MRFKREMTIVQDLLMKSNIDSAIITEEGRDCDISGVVGSRVFTSMVKTDRGLGSNNVSFCIDEMNPNLYFFVDGRDIYVSDKQKMKEGLLLAGAKFYKNGIPFYDKSKVLKSMTRVTNKTEAELKNILGGMLDECE